MTPAENIAHARRYLAEAVQRAEENGDQSVATAVQLCVAYSTLAQAQTVLLTAMGPPPVVPARALGSHALVMGLDHG